MTIPSPEGQRIAPRLPVTAMRTFGFHAPFGSHWRPATCAEVNCPHYLNGWATTVLPDSQDEAVLRGSGRRWVAMQVTEQGWHRYVFPAGQTCFGAARHRVRLDRPAIFTVRDGDWRGNPTGFTRRHTTGASWVEEFAEHQARLFDEQRKG